MPITFGSDYELSASDYWVEPIAAAPSYNPVSTFFSQPPLLSQYSSAPVPALSVPTSAGGTGSASLFDSAKTFVSGFTSQLPALTQAAVNVAQAYTSSGSRITPIVLPSGTVIAGEQQRGAYTPGYMQQVPGFLSKGSPSAPPAGFFEVLPPMVLAAAGLGLVALVLYMRK